MNTHIRFNSWKSIGLWLLLICLAISINGQDAEAKKISGSGKSLGPISESNVFPGDDPQHVITLMSTKGQDSTDDPTFGDVTVAHTELQDKKGSSAKVLGYRVHTHANGDKSFAYFEGTAIYTTEDGSEATFEGRWWITGGTGKYLGIVGEGTYKGWLKLPSVTYEWEGEYEIE